MHVIFIEPAFPRNQREFVRGLKEAGAVVSAIGEAPAEAFSDEMKNWLTFYEQVPSVVHEPSLTEAVRRIQGKGWVDRLEATVEAHIMPAAKARETCGIPGTTTQTAYLCRDKPAMKDALREAGIPTAASMGSDDPKEVRDFAEREGFPLIIKPRSGAGASGTYRADDLNQLNQILEECHVGRGASVAVEEFIEGHEAFYDTLAVDGEVRFDFISHYYPGVLEAMRTREVSPYLLTTNRVDASTYDEVKEMGKKVIEVLGIETSATHMEWFFGPKGLKFSEIGCRPPGVCVWDLYGAANNFDLYTEWARAIIGKGPGRQPSRKYSAGMITVRPDRDGQIAAYEGLDRLEQEVGEWIYDRHLPPVGSSTQPVSGGYMVNAWIRMFHPDYDRLCQIFDHVGNTLKIHAR